VVPDSAWVAPGASTQVYPRRRAGGDLPAVTVTANRSTERATIAQEERLARSARHDFLASDQATTRPEGKD